MSRPLFSDQSVATGRRPSSTFIVRSTGSHVKAATNARPTTALLVTPSSLCIPFAAFIFWKKFTGLSPATAETPSKNLSAYESAWNFGKSNCVS